MAIPFEFPGIQPAQGRQAQVDAGVADEVLWLCRQRSVGEVGWRSDGHEPDVGADAHRDHVLGDLLAKTHARIEPLLDDVGQGLIKGDLNLDVGVVGQELRQLRPEDRLGDMVTRCNPDRAGGFLAELAQRFKLGLDFLQPGTRRLEQTLSRLRRRAA